MTALGLNLRKSPGRGRPKHIFLEERAAEEDEEFRQERQEHEERLTDRLNRRKHPQRKVKSS